MNENKAHTPQRESMPRDSRFKPRRYNNHDRKSADNNAKKQNPKQKNFINTDNRIQKFINEHWSDEEKFDLNNLDIIYNVQGFDDCLALNHPIICNHYYLLSMTWEVSI